MPEKQPPTEATMKPTLAPWDSAIDTLPVYVMDAELNILHANNPAKQVLFSSNHADRLAARVAMIRKAFVNQEVPSQHLLVDGDTTYAAHLDWHPHAKLDRALQVIEMPLTGVLQDTARLKIAFDVAPTGLLVVSPAGVIRLANQSAEEMLGYDSGELIGLSVEELMPAPLRTTHVSERTNYQRDPQRRAMGENRDLRARKKDGTEIRVEVGLSPLAKHRRTEVVASIVDITERLRVQDELRRSNADLERFAYVAAHDLSEPLRSISAFAELLENDEPNLPEKSRERLQKVRGGARRMQDMLSGLLRYARVDGTTSETKCISPSKIAGNAAALFQATTAERSAEIEIDPELPRVLADPAFLLQVFQNLISNALKFTHQDPPRVQISGRVLNFRYVELSVRDWGIGIDPAYHTRIFEIFRRLHGRNAYQGSGIGLSLVKKMIERMGGKIRVESAPELGSTFHFTLPNGAQEHEID